jgi:putative membrane protein insertion efficiency factor
MRKLLTFPLIGLIYIYKYLISPLLPGGCRHYPGCSTYAIDALTRYGPLKGGIMAASRIARCHPWGTHGYDPVPRFIIKKISLKSLVKGKVSGYPACDRLKPPKSL